MQSPVSGAASAAQTVMSRLRGETRAAHVATEAIPFNASIMDGSITRTAFAMQLACLHRVHAALERAIAGADDPAIEAVWHDELVKVTLLEADLRALNVDEAPPAAALQATDALVARCESWAGSDPKALLGMLYVLEGSTLGGMIIRTYIAKALDIDESSGLSYLTPYGNAVKAQWSAFSSRMDEAIPDPAVQDRVVSAASETFIGIGAILAGLPGPSADAAN